jgi:2-polyprenyl-3-methyl-5-hydroxy-6-metoxy-1,4-benzoquinol methylase
MELERIERLYTHHHASRRPPDFVFCEPERSEFFRRVVGGPGRRVLDIGCRTGALTRMYADGNEVVGLDVDRTALAEAERLGIKTVWADVDQGLPFEDESFDVVVAGEVLEHVRFPERLLSEVGRVLRPGGTVVGSVPNSYRLKSRLRFLFGRPPEFADDPTHLHMFRPGDLIQLLRRFARPHIKFVAGRLTRLNPALFANDIVFTAQKPG